MKQKRKKKEPTYQDLLDKREQQIAELHCYATNLFEPEDRSTAFSLSSQYIRKGFLTEKQWRLVVLLLHKGSRLGKSTPGYRAKTNPQVTHYVYIMRCTDKIKIGYSQDPWGRKKDIQTSNANKVFLLAKLACENRSFAKRVEKKLHDEFRQYKTSGEWFQDCILQDVLRFQTPKKYKTAEWIIDKKYI